MCIYCFILYNIYMIKITKTWAWKTWDSYKILFLEKNNNSIYKNISNKKNISIYTLNKNLIYTLKKKILNIHWNSILRYIVIWLSRIWSKKAAAEQFDSFKWKKDLKFFQWMRCLQIDQEASLRKNTVIVFL